MTSEIGIMNKRGIALAADSAVTIGDNRVYNSAIKLFTLDSQHDVGIMIYGNASIDNVPWEVVIKLFREELKGKVKDSLDDYKKSFVKFIEKKHDLFSEKNTIIVDSYVNDYIDILRDDFERECSVSSEIHDPQILLNRVVDGISDFKPQEGFAKVVHEKRFYADYGSEIEQTVKSTIKSLFNFDVNIELMEKIKKSIYRFLISNYFSNNKSGVVFAGYGKKDLFPKLIIFNTDGLYNNTLKTGDEGRVDGKEKSGIIPFAQSDMTQTILNGIDPKLESYEEVVYNSIKDGIIDIVGEKAEEDIEKIFSYGQAEIKNFRSEEISSPIVSMTSSLSLDELAVMAETFVSLTSFKRKFSGGMQTVGGPVDVLVISKSDGPVWIKKKEYFDQELNVGYKLRRK